MTHGEGTADGGVAEGAEAGLQDLVQHPADGTFLHGRRTCSQSRVSARTAADASFPITANSIENDSAVDPADAAEPTADAAGACCGPVVFCMGEYSIAEATASECGGTRSGDALAIDEDTADEGEAVEPAAQYSLPKICGKRAAVGADCREQGDQEQPEAELAPKCQRPHPCGICTSGQGRCLKMACQFAKRKAKDEAAMKCTAEPPAPASGEAHTPHAHRKGPTPVLARPCSHTCFSNIAPSIYLELRCGLTWQCGL